MAHWPHRFLAGLQSDGALLPFASSLMPLSVKGKGKGFPYSTPSVGPEADPSVQAVSLACR